MKLLFKEFTELDFIEHKALLEIRNSNYVKKNMKTESIIEIKDHVEWVIKLKKSKTSLYFAIFEDNSIVGSVSITFINNNESTCIWGIYLKEKINPLVSSISSYLIIERIFNELNLKKIYSEVKKENIAAYKFNIRLGFKEEEKPKEDRYFSLFLDVDTWGKNTNSNIIRIIKKRLDKIEYQFM